MSADLPEKSEASPLAGIFIGRQPIFDRDHASIGYEFLFRDGPQNEAHFSSQRAATADVVCKAFAELGLVNALGARRAFINVDNEFLFDDSIELLPSAQVVLELRVTESVSAEVTERCRQLRAAGYEFSISGVEAITDQLRPILELASYLRINIDGNPEETIKTRATALKSPSWKLIATRVETVEAMRLCKELDFDYLQGYFFAKPTIVEGKKLDASTHNLIRLINLLNADADAAALEPIFKGEPALAINLLRLTNSVGVGLPTKVATVRQAISVLGQKQLQRWLQLLIFSSGSRSGAGIAHNPLMQWAALRGYFTELVAGRCYPTRKEMRDQAYLTGLMSMMPAALGMTMNDILEQISVTNDVKLALSRHEGELGLLLELTERYDDEDMDGASALFAHLGAKLSLQSLNLCLIEAIAWVQQLSVEAD